MVSTRRQSRILAEKAVRESGTEDDQHGEATLPPHPSPTPAEDTQPYQWSSSSPTANFVSQHDHSGEETAEPDAEEPTSEADEDGGEDEINEQSESQLQAPSRHPRGRGRAWQPWEDRILAKEVIAQKAFDPPYGQTAKIWDCVAQVVTEANRNPVDKTKRSAKGCRERWQHLVKCHREEQTRAMQATGTDEEVDEHVQTMTEAVQLIDDMQLWGEKATENARIKLEKERQAGAEMRCAAMQNMVRREELTNVADLETATIRERQGQRKRAAPVNDSNKENTDAASPPRKKRLTFQSTMAAALREHQVKENEALEEACWRGDEHHADLQAGISRLERLMNRVGDALVLSLEHQQRSQDMLLGMIAGSSKERNVD